METFFLHVYYSVDFFLSHLTTTTSVNENKYIFSWLSLTLDNLKRSRIWELKWNTFHRCVFFPFDIVQFYIFFLKQNTFFSFSPTLVWHRFSFFLHFLFANFVAAFFILVKKLNFSPREWEKKFQFFPSSFTYFLLKKNEKMKLKKNFIFKIL